METFWNKRTLSAPPTLTYTAPNDATTTLFLAHVSSAMDSLEQTSALSNEHAVLDRLLYKFNNQLRKEKVIQTMKMIKQALKRVAEMDMKAEFEKFYDSKQRTDGLKVYLPSKQMLQYLLVRLMGYAKLLMRASHCCREAYIYCMQKLGRGDLVRQMLLFASVMSRIWVLSQALGLHAINWYKNLHGYLERLEGAQVDWLPPNETLPPDLHDWLGLGKDLREPKVHSGVYNLGLSDQSKVNLDQLLSKFSEEPSASPTGGDETAPEAGQAYDDPPSESDTTLLSHGTTEALDTCSSNEDRVAHMDLDDLIANVYSYGKEEDIGVSVTIDRSQFNQKSSTPAKDVGRKGSAPTVPKPVPGITIADKASEKPKTVPATGLAERSTLTPHQQKKQGRRDMKELARKMVFEQGVTECNDSMDPILQKFVKMELISFARKSAKQLVRQEGVRNVDSSMGETLKGFMEIEIKRKLDRGENAAAGASKGAEGRDTSDVHASVPGSSVPSKKEESNTLTNRERKEIASGLRLKEKNTAKRKKRQERKKLKLALEKQSEIRGGKPGGKPNQTTFAKSSAAVASSSKSSVAESERLSSAMRHKLPVVADQVSGTERPAKKLKVSHKVEKSRPGSAGQSDVKGSKQLSAEKREVIGALPARVKKHKKRKRGRRQ